MPSASYRRYSASKASPYTSCRPGDSSGHMSDHSPFSATRFMNRSGTHSAVNRSRQRSFSSPWFLRTSRNDSTSACHGSR